MEETKRQVVKLSELPASIIIVGIGDANFDSMEELDGDDALLKDNLGIFHSQTKQRNMLLWKH